MKKITFPGVHLHNWKCAHARLKVHHALLKVCTCWTGKVCTWSTEAGICSTGSVHMLNWKCAHALLEMCTCTAQLEMCTCSSEISMLSIIVCMFHRSYTCTNHRNHSEDVLSLGKACHFLTWDLAKSESFHFSRELWQWARRLKCVSYMYACSANIVHMLNSTQLNSKCSWQQESFLKRSTIWMGDNSIATNMLRSVSWQNSRSLRTLKMETSSYFISYRQTL